MKIRFTKRATENLVEIADYLRERNPAGAMRVRGAILESLKILASFPYAGRAQSTERVRKMITRKYSYLVYYTVDDVADDLIASESTTTLDLRSHAYRITILARALAASSSRFFGGCVVSSESMSSRAHAAIELTARSKTTSLRFDGLVDPLSLRTNWSAASRISSSVAGGSKLNKGLMFRHMACSGNVCVAFDFV